MIIVEFMVYFVTEFKISNCKFDNVTFSRDFLSFYIDNMSGQNKFTIKNFTNLFCSNSFFSLQQNSKLLLHALLYLIFSKIDL